MASRGLHEWTCCILISQIKKNSSCVLVVYYSLRPKLYVALRKNICPKFYVALQYQCNLNVTFPIITLTIYYSLSLLSFIFQKGMSRSRWRIGGWLCCVMCCINFSQKCWLIDWSISSINAFLITNLLLFQDDQFLTIPWLQLKWFNIWKWAGIVKTKMLH